MRVDSPSYHSDDWRDPEYFQEIEELIAEGKGEIRPVHGPGWDVHESEQETRKNIHMSSRTEDVRRAFRHGRTVKEVELSMGMTQNAVKYHVGVLLDGRKLKRVGERKSSRGRSATIYVTASA